ncbi:hypothetical protein IC582_001751 [Cucumis melo]
MTVQMHKPFEQTPLYHMSISQALTHSSFEVHFPLNDGLCLKQIFPSVSSIIHPIEYQKQWIERQMPQM